MVTQRRKTNQRDEAAIDRWRDEKKRMPDRLTSSDWRNYRPLLVWMAGLILYAGDFLVKRLPVWREPVSIEVWLDHAIPFVPAWSWVYLLLWIVFLFGATGWYIWENRDDWARVRSLLLAAILMQVGAWIIQAAIPTYMPRPILPDEVGGAADWLIDRIYAADPPTHALPSLHVASVLVAAWFYGLGGRPLRAAVGTLFVVLVSLSVLFTKQHGVLDVFAGLAWGYLACRLGRYCSVVLGDPGYAVRPLR